MTKPGLSRVTNRAASVALIFVCLSVTAAQSLGPTARTSRYFESIRNSPPQLLAFLRQMPKGADLHNHLSGAVYAESYIQWAADSGDCINLTTMYASLPPCTRSGPVPPKNVSLPLPPNTVAEPLPATNVLLPLPPVICACPAPP